YLSGTTFNSLHTSVSSSIVCPRLAALFTKVVSFVVKGIPYGFRGFVFRDLKQLFFWRIQNPCDFTNGTCLLRELLTSYILSIMIRNHLRMKQADLATKFCVQALELSETSATNQEMFEVGEKVCAACFKFQGPFSKTLSIIEIVLGAMAKKCKVEDQGMDVYFLKLVAYCIKGFQKLTDDLHNSVASLFTRLAESYSVVKDKVCCLLQLYGYSFVGEVSFYISSDKDKKNGNNTVRKVLNKLENKLAMIKSIMDKEAISHEWSESYSLGRKLLCENLSLILTNTFKDTSDELKDEPDSANLPPIKEFLFADIRKKDHYGI
nr:hypothetical protein [Tanacetum cinerariifolium]